MKIMRFVLSFILMAFLSLSGYGQSFISVNDLLGMRNSFVKNNKNWQTILSNRGYNKSQTIEGELYIYKNCRLTIIDDGSNYLNGQVVEADNKTSNASIVNIYKAMVNWHEYLFITVTVYGKVNAQKWATQLKALGYKINKEMSSSGWYYEKKGSPDITLTNEGTTYRLGTMGISLDPI